MRLHKLQKFHFTDIQCDNQNRQKFISVHPVILLWTKWNQEVPHLSTQVQKTRPHVKIIITVGANRTGIMTLAKQNDSNITNEPDKERKLMIQ